MQIDYVAATPELKSRFKELSGPYGGADFIQFDDQHFSLVAVVENEPVGIIVARRQGLAAPVQILEEAMILIIEVLPQYRRNGIGQALVEKTLAWAQGQEITQARAWSEEIRTEAHMLWNKLGFTFARADFQRPGEEPHYGFYVAKRL
jgi:GNAT superfamily N-acetyltransferase